MRRASLTFLMILMIATMSAFAQKKGPINPIGGNQEISIQDENGGGFLVFNKLTGEYKCVFCEYDYTLSGTGKVMALGCIIYFSDVQDGYSVVASVSMCRQQGKVAAEMYEVPGLPKQDPIHEFWNDYSLLGNTLDCGKKPME